jgi:N-acyl-D-amino-acid deacylase
VIRRTFVSGVAAALAGIPPLPKWAAGPVWASGRRGITLLLRGAAVYDGAGAPPVEADVAVDGDRIAAVGPSLDGSGAPEVDLRGLALAPGFIDLHSHTDIELLVGPRCESKVRQGVTTEVTGPDGASMGPWTAARAAAERAEFRRIYGIDLGFRDLGGWFRRLERERIAVNSASMVGAGTVRGTVVGPADRPATRAELAAMVALVQEAARAGACGISSGLEYAPGGFATTEELAALCEPFRATGLPYATHMRSEDDELFAAVEEALNIGRRAGVPVHISHLKAQGRPNYWKGEMARGMLDAARQAGLDVTFDRYPYVAYATALSQVFPLWALDGGTPAFLRRLRDPALRERISSLVEERVRQLDGEWDGILITSTSSGSLNWAVGRRLGELARERETEPYALLVRLMREDRASTRMVGFGMSEDDTVRMLAHPLGMVSSDGTALASSGPLAAGVPHPRSYGTFPRVLGHYCRERRLMPLETAIRKMTSMPADRIRLEGRGRITPGAFADLVAFDPARVADRATFEQPHQYPAGIPWVWVNGRAVIRDGEHTGELPGRVLKAGPDGTRSRSPAPS